MYRDDRDAQLARLDALDHENRVLRDENDELRRALTHPEPSRADHAHETLPAPISDIAWEDRHTGLGYYLADPNIRIGIVLTLVPIALGILAIVTRMR